MPNIELLEKSLPVAPIRIAALAGCRELAQEVDKKLVKFRKELVYKNSSASSLRATARNPSWWNANVSVLEPEKAKAISGNPYGAPTFISWLTLPITARPTRSAAAKTTCPRTTTIRI